MSQEIDEFLEALKSIINSEISEMKNTVEPDILAIKEQAQQRISQLELETQSQTYSQAMNDSFQRELSKIQLEWIKRSNFEKGRLLDQLVAELEEKFKKISTGDRKYEVLNKLFQEIKSESGDNFEVHITKTCNPEEFKIVSGIKQNIIADLDHVGILVKRLDFPMIIENSLEARFAKNKDDLIMNASQQLWSDLEESPWQIQNISSRLLSNE
jgi:vacuolar-type H+-ATPase subunit E/Vma4